VNVGIAVPRLGFHGGLERYAHAIARGLSARGHDVTALFDDDAAARDRDAFLAPFAAARRVGTPGRLLDVVFAQRIADPDALDALPGRALVVAAHDHALTCARAHRYLPLDASPCHRAPGAGCIARGCVVVRDRSADACAPVRVVDPFRLARRARALAARAPIVACSRYVADRLADAGARRDRLHVVHPILAPDGEAPIVPRPVERRLAVVGQLVRGKGVDFAIEALARLPRDVTLDVHGDGPQRAALEALAMRRAPGRVRFHGYTPPEAIAQAYDAASVVLAPARWPEPFGMTGIEAMRRARPVVGARHGGIVEWLRDGCGGATFTPGDVGALARATLDLLDDADAGHRALEESRRFDPEATLDAIERLLTDAARAA
jgi:glycosyltransferase involved in cell wall biosynthesis